MRTYVKEEHVLKSEEVDAFIEKQEKNGFKITDVSLLKPNDYSVKSVIIEKWNMTKGIIK